MPIYPRFSKRKNAMVYDVVIVQGRKRVWHRGIESEPQAKRLETKLERERDQGTNIAQSRISVEDYLTDWLKGVRSSVAAKTADTYGFNLRAHVIPQLGKKRLRDLTPKDVQDRYGEIAAFRSKKTALNVHRVLSQALSHAVRMELISRNVCEQVKAPKPEPYRVKVRPMEEIDRILDAADQTLYGPMTRLCIWTGLRQGELLNLRWSEVDLDAGVLYVAQAKHDSVGAVLLAPEAVSLLRAHGVAEEIRLSSFGPNFKRAPYVFTNSVGAQMDAGGLRRAWARIKKTAKVEMRFHDLRHAHAAMLIRGGVHSKVIQERLRHKQISTTMDIYGHLMPGLQAEAVQRISDAMRGDG